MSAERAADGTAGPQPGADLHEADPDQPDHGEGLVEVISSGDRRRSLEALRDLLAGQLDRRGHHPGCACECGVGDLRQMATLAGRIAALMAEIDQLPAPEPDELDRLASEARAEDRPAPA